MAKVVRFPHPTPEKFGFKPVRKDKEAASNTRQLNLFEGGRIVKMTNLSTFEEALILDERGDPLAQELYLKAITENDRVSDAYCNLGILESQVNNYSKAIDYFTLCLKHDPRHDEGHYNLANLYAEIGNLALAKIHYETAIQLEPDFPNSHFNLGLTLAKMGDATKAVDELCIYRKLSDKEDFNQLDQLIATISITHQK